MVPSIAPVADADPTVAKNSEQQTTNTAPEQSASLNPGREAKPSKPVNGQQETDGVKKTSQGSAMSGKAAKEKAKAEKAARRAQEKQKNSQPVVDLKGGNPAETTKTRRDSIAAPGGVGTHKGQHKKTGSIGQKSLPIRQNEPQTAAPRAEPRREGKRVALCEHLYGHSRRTGLAGAAKDVHPAVLALGLQMSNYVICGSNARCVATMLVFKQVIDSYVTPPQNSLPRHLPTHLSSQIDYIVSCRPLSISMGNAIRWLKVAISEIDISTTETTAKSQLCEAIDNFIHERITVADQVISASAAEKIKDGDVILTYAKSSIVQKTLAEAYQQGKKFKVIVVDSRPLHEGKNLARALAALGIDVQYTLIAGIDHVIGSTTKVLLGAHGMLSNGRLTSRVGTALVAMAAKEADKPTIVCCESIKFTDRVALDSLALNEVAPPDELFGQDSPLIGMENWRDVPNLQLLNLMYDLTPAEYIDMVVTEYGSIPPSSVPVIHRLCTNS